MKQTSAKLKFTLNGTVARDLDCLNTALQSAHDRLDTVETALSDTLAVLNKVKDNSPQINVCCLHWPYQFYEVNYIVIYTSFNNCGFQFIHSTV